MRITYTITVEVADDEQWRHDADMIIIDREEGHFPNSKPLDETLTGDERRADAVMAIPSDKALEGAGIASITRTIAIEHT